MGRGKQGKEAEEKRFVNRLPHYGQFDRARLGYFSLTADNVKFISKEDSLTVSGEQETPGYFFGKFMKGLWCAKRDASPLSLSYPYKAIPGKFPSGIYVDLRQAFKQIVDAFGAEVFVQEGRMVAYGETIPSDYPCFENKICRGLLVTGTGRNGSYQEWINRDLRTVTFSNPSYAPHIRHAVWATLHAIQTVLNPHTIYAHTDGFIIPSWRAETVFSTLDKAGFRYVVKYSGAGEVYGVGNYRIGHHRSLTTNRDVRTRENIRSDNAFWWVDKFTSGLSLRNEHTKSQLFDAERTDE